MKKVKVNPILKRSVGQVRDEKLNCYFTHDEWCDVTEEDWKRLKEATFKHGDLRVSMYVADGEAAFGNVDTLEKAKTAEPVIEEEPFWEEDEVQEEE
jgi:hypothetical protein